ncbi:MAG: ABC transporter ATP-binding protein, partial [Clostridia bacterium]|nr:ABC transporter ATP-binding protein [Clostridia bacterium]
MREFYPLLLVGGVAGAFSLIFLIAFLSIKDRKEAIGFERNMKDSELTRRLLAYAKPHWRAFALVLTVMLFSIAYDIVSPLIVGHIEEMIKDDFPMGELLSYVAVYAGILAVSLICSYVQAIVLQRTGQKIVSSIREDLFTHIEHLSHAQLNSMPVGKLVTRVTNDTGAISMMFTGIIVNLVKNTFVILGVLAAMLLCNYLLTLMVLCFVPFIVLFTVIFRKFSRAAYRKVKDGTTDINTYLSEHLSGMKIIQIFNREEQKKAEFDEKNRALGKAKRSQIFVFGVFRPVVYMLYISSVLCLLYLGGRGYIRGVEFMGQTISSGTLVTFYMYISKFFNPIQSLAEQFNWLQSAFASAEKIFTILDISPEITDAPDAVELETVRGDIEFKNVWFAYNPGEWVLKDV